MASFSSATRELVLKIVYYGPGLGGKTTSLQALHAAVRPEHRGKMVSLATPVDRTLYFDFLPVRLPSVGEMQLRMQLFTVPGQVYFNATRKLVLTGADGLVFVADSQEARLDANLESLNNLRDNLAELGRALESVPLVLAYNKRDLPGVLSLTELDERLNPHGFPSLGTSAATGRGVFDVLDAVVRLVLDDLRARKVLPADVAVPTDGIIAERLADVRAAAPQSAEPARVVVGETPRTSPSGVPTAFALDGHARPTTRPPVPVSALLAQAELQAAAAVAATARTSSSVPGAPGNGHGTTPPAAARRGGVSLAALFEPEDQETLRTVEDALGEAILPRAVLLLEALLVRVLERAARALGRADAPPEAIAWSLALPAERYARVRATAQRARRGGAVSRRDALEAYVVVATAQLAAADLSR